VNVAELVAPSDRMYVGENPNLMDPRIEGLNHPLWFEYHGGSVNLLFGDNHVESATRDQVGVGGWWTTDWPYAVPYP
jgi:prepilin-type processing-associated H-X9-DG protein